MTLYSLSSSLLIFIRLLGRGVILFAREVGQCSIFVLHSVQYAFIRPFYFKQFLRGLLEIGFFSVPVVGMTAIFTGAVLVLQSYTGFSRFAAENSIPTVVVLSITRELGPVLTGLMVAGRMGSSIAAEIATMKVTEQVDALVTLSVNPIKYLVTPRIIAGVIVFPLLVLIANSIGIMGGYIVATDILAFNKVAYIKNTVEFLEMEDVVSGIIKAVIFGLIVTFCGCYHGMSSKRGASGVGVATINAVVMSSILILFFNYITTGLLFSK